MGSWLKTKWISRGHMDQIFELVRKPNQLPAIAYYATWDGVPIEGSWHRTLGPSVQLLAAIVAVDQDERSDVIESGSIELLRGFDRNAHRVSDGLRLGHAQTCDVLIDLMASYCEQCPHGTMATALPSVMCMDPKLAVEISGRTLDKLSYLWPKKTDPKTIDACRSLQSKARRAVDRHPSTADITQAWRDVWAALDIASRVCIDPTRKTDTYGIARRLFCDSVRESSPSAYSSVVPADPP